MARLAFSLILLALPFVGLTLFGRPGLAAGIGLMIVGLIALMPHTRPRGRKQRPHGSAHKDWNYKTPGRASKFPPD